ncbi:MAG: putative accessory gene regulator protein [Pelotomaculum sp. PtaB.Bin104]|nr:MAG: putative accessory gene regulator protein [Pelotomaculum sp. PtaB.Bin104]
MTMAEMAEKAAVHLTGELALDAGKTDFLRYGLEIIFCTLIKAVSLFSLAYLLGIIPEVAFALFFWSIYRMASGGAHCSGYWRCLSLGLIIFVAAGKLGLYLEPYISMEVMGFLLPAGFLLAAVCVLIWAPGEGPYSTVTGTARRRFYQLVSLVCLGLWLAASWQIMVHYSASIVIAGFIAVLIQTFSFTPPGFQAIERLDSLMEGLFKRKGGKNQCCG